MNRSETLLIAALLTLVSLAVTGVMWDAYSAEKSQYNVSLNTLAGLAAAIGSLVVMTSFWVGATRDALSFSRVS